MLRFYLRLLAPVVIVCAVASAGLAGTYAVTKDRIELQDKLAQDKALKSALPAADSFEMLGEDQLGQAKSAGGETEVDAIFVARDESGDSAGWGIIVKPRGYGGPMRVVVGLDGNGKVTGVTVVSHNETPGLGTKVVGSASGEPPAYLGTFAGVDTSAAAAKLDTITGATKSSRGVRDGVEAALRVFEDVLKSGGDRQ